MMELALNWHYSGVVMSLGFAIDNMMVTVCWANSKAEGFLRTMKFVEMTSSNMLAITNLAICVNLALIVSVSKPTMSGLKSAPSMHVHADVDPKTSKERTSTEVFYLKYSHHLVIAKVHRTLRC